MSPEHIDCVFETVFVPTNPRTVTVIVCSAIQLVTEDEKALNVIWSPLFKLPGVGV